MTERSKFEVCGKRWRNGYAQDGNIDAKGWEVLGGKFGRIDRCTKILSEVRVLVLPLYQLSPAIPISVRPP